MSVAQIVHWMSNIRKRKLAPFSKGTFVARTKMDRSFIGECADVNPLAAGVNPSHCMQRNWRRNTSASSDR